MESSSIPEDLREEFKPINRANIFIHQPTLVVIEAKDGAQPVLVNPMEMLPVVRIEVMPSYQQELWPSQYKAFRHDSKCNTITVKAHSTLLRLFKTEPLLICSACGTYTFDPRSTDPATQPQEPCCQHTELTSCLSIRVNSKRPLFINLKESIADESNDTSQQMLIQSPEALSGRESLSGDSSDPPEYTRSVKPSERPLNVRHRPSAKPTPPNFVRIGTHLILHQPTRLLIHTRTRLEIFNPYASQRTFAPVFPRLRQWASLTEWSPIYNQLNDAENTNFLKIMPDKEFASVLSVSEIALCSKCQKVCFKWTAGCDLYNDNSRFKDHTKECGTGKLDYIIVEGLQTQNIGDPRFLLIEKDGIKTVYDDSDVHKFPQMLQEKKENGHTTLHFTEHELKLLQGRELEAGLEITRDASVSPQGSAEASFLETKVNVLKSDAAFIQIAPEIFFHKPSKLMLRTILLQKLVTIINPEIGGTFQRMRKEVEQRYRPFIKKAPPPWSSKYRKLTEPKTSNVVFFTPDGVLTELLKFEKLLLCSSCRKMAYPDKPATKKELPKHRTGSPECKDAHWVSCRGVATTQMSKAFFIIAGSESE